MPRDANAQSFRIYYWCVQVVTGSTSLGDLVDAGQRAVMLFYDQWTTSTGYTVGSKVNVLQPGETQCALDVGSLLFGIQSNQSAQSKAISGPDYTKNGCSGPKQTVQVAASCPIFCALYPVTAGCTQSAAAAAVWREC